MHWFFICYLYIFQCRRTVSHISHHKWLFVFFNYISFIDFSDIVSSRVIFQLSFLRAVVTCYFYLWYLSSKLSVSKTDAIFTHSVFLFHMINPYIICGRFIYRLWAVKFLCYWLGFVGVLAAFCCCNCCYARFDCTIISIINDMLIGVINYWSCNQWLTCLNYHLNDILYNA